jgi:hypothetical protein
MLKKAKGRLNACPTAVRELLVLLGGAGFACESALPRPFSASC